MNFRKNKILSKSHGFSENFVLFNKHITQWKPSYDVKKSVEITTEWYFQTIKQRISPEEVTNQQIENYMYENNWY